MTSPVEFSDSRVTVEMVTPKFGVSDEDKGRIKADAVRLCDAYGRYAIYVTEECENVDLIRCSIWHVHFACAETYQEHCAIDAQRKRACGDLLLQAFKAIAPELTQCRREHVQRTATVRPISMGNRYEPLANVSHRMALENLERIAHAGSTLADWRHFSN